MQISGQAFYSLLFALNKRSGILNNKGFRFSIPFFFFTFFPNFYMCQCKTIKNKLKNDRIKFEQ